MDLYEVSQMLLFWALVRAGQYVDARSRSAFGFTLSRLIGRDKRRTRKQLCEAGRLEASSPGMPRANIGKELLKPVRFWVDMWNVLALSLFVLNMGEKGTLTEGIQMVVTLDENGKGKGKGKRGNPGRLSVSWYAIGDVSLQLDLDTDDIIASIRDANVKLSRCALHQAVNLYSVLLTDESYPRSGRYLHEKQGAHTPCHCSHFSPPSKEIGCTYTLTALATDISAVLGTPINVPKVVIWLSSPAKTFPPICLPCVRLHPFPISASQWDPKPNPADHTFSVLPARRVEICQTLLSNHSS
ncbi:hypothetical protein ACRALDRAFT_2022626 [Sodiomyces alcalophilus JCM 7366]|uniref:uncharacterized protein n=1 Tax=Sodiomyces alcalophilus JCM 7366 TaxID=591952 RepID=UPI0039B43AB2